MASSARDEAMARRNSAVLLAAKRKEEYLGARVPKALRDRVVQIAKDRGVPVSILLRNVLEEAFKDEERLAIFDVSGGGAHTGSSESGLGEYAAVLGWSRILLNKTVPCTGCGVQLAAGKDVSFGLGAAQPVILCDVCNGSI